MEYLALLEQLHLPHLLIIGGTAFVLFGVVGIIVGGSRDVRPEASEALPRREKARLSLSPPSQPTEW